MSDNSVDPSGNTEAFRAFTQNPAAEPTTSTSRTPIIIGAIVVAVIAVALIIWALA